MSFNTKLQNALDSTLEEYMKKVASTYSIEYSALKELWNGSSGSLQSGTVNTVSDCGMNKESLSMENLIPLKKDKLQLLCRERGLKTSGTKDSLMALLVKWSKQPCVDTERKTTITNANGSSTLHSSKVNSSQKIVEKKPVTQLSSSKKNGPKPVIRNLLSKAPVMAVVSNTFGNLEHSETGLVFDRKTKKVVGKQNTSGTVDDLTKEDIQTCKEYNFTWEQPENIDSGDTQDEHVEELSDHERGESSDEEPLEEEELIAEDEDDFEVEEEDEDE